MNKKEIIDGNGAEISDDKKHRFALWRIWNTELPKVMFIGVNPSTADAETNDATIRRCIKFAKDWGFGGMYFGNLFSFRTRDTKVLIENFTDAIRAETDEWLKKMIAGSDKIVCSWGNWQFNVAREAEVLSMIPVPMCLATNKNGTPKHPLYCASALIPSPFLSPESHQKSAG